MVRIAVCDDEEVILYDLSKKITDILKSKNVPFSLYEARSARALLEKMLDKPADLLFLDIDMPEMDGMDVARLLQEARIQTLLVFVTNQETLVYDSFRYHPFGFIRKRLFETEIQQVLTSALKSLEEREDWLCFRHKKSMVRLKPAEIVYFEADSNYVKCFCQKENFHFRYTLGQMEKEMAGRGFIRIHKGFLVNQRCIQSIQNEAVVLNGGQTLPLGRVYRDEARASLLKWMR